MIESYVFGSQRFCSGRRRSEKEAVHMTAILGSIAGNLIKMVILGAVAVAGVICGRKFRDKKDAEKAAKAASGSEKE